MTMAHVFGALAIVAFGMSAAKGAIAWVIVGLCLLILSRQELR